MKKLSVIIVTYNSLGDIFDCLDSVFRFSDIPEDELEVIVVGMTGTEVMVRETMWVSAWLRHL